MALKQKTSRSFFDIEYTEKDAIRDHAVVRFKYAIQLINKNTDDTFVKAYAWLSLAADEVDMHKEANRIKRKVEFELKSRGLFAIAGELEREYRKKYSAEAMLKKIKNSYHPIYILLRLPNKIFKGFDSFVDVIDRKVFNRKGNPFLWGVVIFCAWSTGVYILLTLKELNRMNFIILFIITLICAVSAEIFENRMNDKNIN